MFCIRVVYLLLSIWVRILKTNDKNDFKRGESKLLLESILKKERKKFKPKSEEGIPQTHLIYFPLGVKLKEWFQEPQKTTSGMAEYQNAASIHIFIVYVCYL